MSAIVLYIAASVDGFIARPDGDISWLTSFEHSGEDYGYAALLQRSGAIVMGGRTFRQVLGFGPWPYQDIPCYVFTGQGVGESPPPLVTACAGDIAPVVAQIRRRTSKDIWLVGGSHLIAQFARAGLIDEYIIAIIPVLLGAGIALFAGSGQQELVLGDAKAYPSGLVQLRYRPATPVHVAGKDHQPQ